MTDSTESKANTHRFHVIESMTSAGIPDALAIGIVNVLADAGFSQLSELEELDRSKSNIVTLVQTTPNPTFTHFLRFPPVIEILPTLLLRHDQRVTDPERKRRSTSHAYARFAVKSSTEHVLILTQAERVA